MDFSYDEDEQALRELSRKILEDHITQDRLKEGEGSEDRIDRKAWNALAEANRLGVALPEEYGGSDLGLGALVILHEEIGRTVAPVPVYATLVLGALPVAEFGSEEANRRARPTPYRDLRVPEGVDLSLIDAEVQGSLSGFQGGMPRLPLVAPYDGWLLSDSSSNEGARKTPPAGSSFWMRDRWRWWHGCDGPT